MMPSTAARKSMTIGEGSVALAFVALTAILLNNHISAAPVIGEKGELVGIVL
jgi:hypothetical protein